MSTATAFVFPGSFPFCAADISASINYGDTYVDNLDKADVMAFFWNVETFSITTTGTATKSGNTVSADCVITLDPIGSTVRAYAAELDAGDWMDTSAPTTPTAFASWPSIRQPVERICHRAGLTDVDDGVILAIRWSNDTTDLIDNCSFLRFAVGTDPGNAGKFRLYYNFRFNFRAGTGGTLREMEFHEDSGAGGTAITNGTFVIGGITFDWYSYYRGDSYTGGTLSATSGSFTY